MQKTPAPRSGPVSAGSVRRVLGAATLAALLAGAVAAQEVEIAVSGDNEALEEFLVDVSILSQLPEEAVAQDYVAAARAEYRNLLTALYAKAYYGAAISIRIDGQEAAGIEPLDAPGRIGRIAVRVDPGPRYVFGQARIAPLAPGTELPAEFARGEQAEAEIVRQAALAGIEGWRAVGHAKADVADQEIVARHGADRIDASVTLAPGPRLTFGPLIVEGNENVRTAAIQNIVGLPTGEVFSPEELEAAARRLRQTGAFDSVAVREGAIGPGDTLPITFVVAEALPRRIGAGIEYSTVEGLALSAYWMHRNAFGAAERFRIEGEVAYKNHGFDRIVSGGTTLEESDDLTLDFTTWSGMVNGLVDIGPSERINGFVGGGIGFASTELDLRDTRDTNNDSDSDSDSGFAWQLLAGVRAPVSPSIDVGLKYRYFNQSGITFIVSDDDDFNTDFSSHSVLLTLTYKTGPASR